MPTSIPQILETLKKNSLFKGFSKNDLEALIPLVRKLSFKENEYVMHEGDSPDDIFIIESGEVEVLKKEANSEISHRIALLQSPSDIGELALLDKSPRSATVRTTQPTILLAISIAELERSSVYLNITKNLASQTSERLKGSNESVVAILRKELDLEKTRVAMANLMVNMITLIALYSIALGAVSRFTKEAISTTVIGAPILSILAAVCYFLIKRNPYPINFYGLTFINWNKSLKVSIFCTIPFLALLTLVKYILILKNPALSSEPLFNHDAISMVSTNGATLFFNIALMIVYFLFIPIQELVYRGLMQGSLQEFLVGKHTVFFSILISNLVFSMSHLHISFVLALIVFFPGVMWGWIYSRYRTLVGVCASHLMVGGYAFFVLGVNGLIKAFG